MNVFYPIINLSSRLSISSLSSLLIRDKKHHLLTQTYENTSVEKIYTNIIYLLHQVLPQYRNDRKIKKEKYDECLRLIQELRDCDDFEDISTLRVSDWT